MSTTPQIAGYDYGHTPHSPVTLDEFALLKATAGFTDADQQALHRAADVLAPNAEALVDGWRKIIGSQQQLAHWFVGPGGKGDERYKAAVKPRFVQWVVDLCTKPLDQDWLDYQQEIALRHTPAKKNLTDHANTPAHVPLRYLLAFVPPILESVRGRLQDSGLPPDEIERMHSAWTKAVMLSVTLWSRPYTSDDLW